MGIGGGLDSKRFAFDVQADGQLTLSLLDKDGATRSAFGLFPDGRPSLVFLDNNRIPCAALGVGMTDCRLLSLLDRTGTEIIKLPQRP